MKYLTPQQIQTALDCVDYRDPAITWALFTHPYEGYQNVCLAITFAVPNSYKQGEVQAQRVNVPVPPIVSADHLWDWLKWRMQTIGLHELNEMFWVDGKPLLDPHTESYWQTGEYLP